ncbi:hypothetical protein ACVIHF_002068 [Bradyrhizobium sp. USDA 4506]
MAAPFDLADRAGPGLEREECRVALHEFAVETRIVGDNHDRIGGEFVDARLIESMAFDHLVGDAGQRRDLRGNGDRRLVEAAESIYDPSDPPVRKIGELDHPELDDLVAGRIEAGGLDVEQDRGLGRLPVARRKVGARNQPAQHPVVG